MRFPVRFGPTALAVLITVLNAAKPAAVDDSAYLLFARHLAAHPFDPYGFDLFWYKQPEPAMSVLLPPVLPYWMAAGIAVFGDHLVLLKLWLLPFALAFCHAARFLLRRFARGAEDHGLMLMACSPFVLPLFNVMLDVPAVALGLTAAALFVHGCDRGRRGFVLAAGVTAGLAMQTKYTMLAVPVVFGGYGITHRRIQPALEAGLLAALVFVGWEVALELRYGESHFVHQLRDHTTRPEAAGLTFGERVSAFVDDKTDLVQPLTGYLGGLGLTWGLIAAGALGAGRRLVAGVAVAAAAGIGIVCVLPFADTVLLVNRTTGSVRLALPTLLFGALGTAVLASLAAAAFRLGFRFGPQFRLRRSADSWFLIGWLGIELATYFALTPFPAGRRVLGVCVVGGLVALRLAGLLGRRHPDRLPGRWSTAFGIALGVGLFALDAWDSLPERQLVDEAAAVIGDPGPHRVWTQGHWGWQHYADRRGWELIVPGRSQLRAGDWLVQPTPPDPNGWYRPEKHDIARVDPGAVEPVVAFTWLDALSAQTIPPLYGGTVPVTGRDHPRLRVVVYRVTRDWLPEPGP